MKKALTMNLQQFNIDNFIPSLWSGELLVSLKNALVYGQEGVVNRNYQGEISAYGDTVKINSIGTVTVGDYTKNVDIGSPENLSGEQIQLVIDQSKFFNFQVDDIDQAQQHPKVMQQAMREAGYALRNVADLFIATRMYTGSRQDMQMGSDAEPITPTPATAYELLVDLSVKLDEKNVPEEGRFVVVPPWYEGLLLKDDRFVKTGSLPAEDRLANGMIGRAGGFNILKSNNVPHNNGARYKIIAGSPIAFSYAEQINQVEAFRPEQRFADAVKGLHLYGGKLVRPEALAVLTANRA